MKKSLVSILLFVSLMLCFGISDTFADEVLVPNVVVNSDYSMPFTLMNLHNASDTPIIVQGSILSAEDLTPVSHFNLEIPADGKRSINSRDLLFGRYENCEGVLTLDEGEYVLVFSNTVACGLELDVNTSDILVDYLDVDPANRFDYGKS